MSETQLTTRERELAERVRQACLDAALQAYEYAGLSGLCQEGRWDLAIDAIRSLNVQEALGQAKS